MSRVGKLGITIPAGVTVEYKDSLVTVTGPKGNLSQVIDTKDIDVKIADGTVSVVLAEGGERSSHAKHGLYRQLIFNMVQGVVTPFTRTIIVHGVGFRVAVAGKKLTMSIGFSHPVEYIAPEGISLSCPDQNTIVVTGINKQQVGQVAATIRAKRKVEPYHLYGLRYSDEVVVKKEGKTAGK